MVGPANGTYIVQGEVNLVVTAMRRNSRWASHAHHDDDQDPLLNSFSQLKDILNTITALDEVSPNEFLGPFLEVIRSEDTTGPITGLALTSVNKFLQYGLIDAKCDTAAAAIENIADAVTHARFVGTDQSTDEVVLMKILHVLRTLMLTPAGMMLTNESVCEIMQSCFRICFEMRLSELLRKSAENTLMDMVQLLFSRLPHFKEDPKWATSLKKLKMRTGGMDPSRKYKKKSPKHRGKKQPKDHQHKHSPHPQQQQPQQQQQQQPPQQQQQQQQQQLAPPATKTSRTPSQERQSEPQDIAITMPAIESGTSDSTPGTTPPTTQQQSQQSQQQEADCLESGEQPPSTFSDMGLTEHGDIIATTPVTGNRTVVDIQQSFQEVGGEQEEMGREDIMIESIDEMTEESRSLVSLTGLTKSELELDKSGTVSDYDGSETTHSAAEHSDGASVNEVEYINPRGVRFTPQPGTKEDGGPLIPYGLPCVRELFRFLISLTNPLDRHNTDVMIHMGLSLITVALESGADAITSYTSLMVLVKDDILKNLFFLLGSERLTLFAASIRVCFLLFEAMRSHLKLQMEMYISKLMDIIVSDSQRVSYEQREIALESIVQLLRIPGLVTEIYLNYDCDLYCSNLFEELMKLLSKNAFPVSGLFNTHLLSLDALLAVIDSIEQHCHHRILHNPQQNTPATEHGESGGGEERTRGGIPEENEDDDDDLPPVPAASGYTVGERLHKAGSNTQHNNTDESSSTDRNMKPRIRPNRMKVCGPAPTEECLAAIKHKKKVYHTGAEQFNVKPAKGIAYLQENGLLATPLDPAEVAKFLRENPKIDKKMIGEYISSRKNENVLLAFLKTFHFEAIRVDEALRMYLEAFRLPGEAPVISYILEHFASYWQEANGKPFVHDDAAFTLAYAVIMLNVDQHNTNAKKQNIPMTVNDFKRNVKGVNGGLDFNQEMLEEMFLAIRDNEIVMPSEQTGVVKENYLWKTLLRRGATKEGVFTHVETGTYDRDLFTLVWGPAVAALSFVFDKSLDESIIFKAISGFRKFAMISAHYGISDVFDNLVISLCKFTTLLSATETAEYLPVQFGHSSKAQMAAKTVFALAHRHGDILREGWKNILDCMLQLYRAKMLPDILISVEDFVDPSGRISLIKEEKVMTRTDSGVLSSFYSYFTSSEQTPQRTPSSEDQRATKVAIHCIEECHIEQIIQDTKFLRLDSLQELIKALIWASRLPEMSDTGGAGEEDGAVFFLELLIKVVLQNRDRVLPFWQSVRDHLYNLIVNANEPTLLVERAVVGLLRVAIRLLRREDVAAQVLASLRILLMMKPKVVHAVSRQVSYGLHDLLKTNAANIHSQHDWFTLFTLLEVAGAGTDPPPLLQVGVQNITESISDAGAQSDSEVSSTTTGYASEAIDRGYTSDTELHSSTASSSKISSVDDTSSWQVVNREDLVNNGGGGSGRPSPHPPVAAQHQMSPMSPTAAVNQYDIALMEELKYHDQKALLKCCESLAFLVRDAAHVTPHNFESCVHCLRTFIEASINGGPKAAHAASQEILQHNSSKDQRRGGGRKSKRNSAASGIRESKSMPNNLKDATDGEDKDKADGYDTMSIQLLDLMHTLHTRAADIFKSWAAEMESKYQQQRLQAQERGEELGEEAEQVVDAGASTLWLKCWCPLLQGIARLCCDTRREVRGQAFTYLQRALLVHDLQTLSAVEWENCFNKVLFPLLHKLLNNINPLDSIDTEEARVRGSTLLCKVYLQHLTPLISLSTFTALWLTILEFMDKYMRVDQSGLLNESVPESLKNMLLVMHTAGILSSNNDDSQLWRLTWDRIDSLLPNLKYELFQPCETEPVRSAIERESQAGPSPPSRNAPPARNAPSPVHSPSHSRPSSPENQTKSDNRSKQSSPVHFGSEIQRTDSPVTISLHPPLPHSTKAPPTLPILLPPNRTDRDKP